MRRVCLLLLALTGICGRATAQTDEIQVYDGGLAPPGVFNLTVHTNYIQSGISEAAYPGAVTAGFTGVSNPLGLSINNAFGRLWPANAPYGLGGILHCFSEGPREAEEALAIGFHISFAGIVTFPKAPAIQEAARITPAERLLIETDAPYRAPVPRRGKRNEPAYVVETARKLAELRGVTLEEIARTTSENWRRLCLSKNV